MASARRDETFPREPALLDRTETTPTAAALVRRRRTRLQLAIFAGGAGGALARAGLARAFPWPGHGWPWVTFSVNVVGTLLLGYFVTRLQERLPPSTFRRPLLGTGLCGALTTFSTLQIELIKLARHGEVALAAVYLLASVAAGLVGMYLASVLTRRGPR